MNIDEFIDKITDLGEQISSKLPDITQAAALDATATIKNRIIQNGISADGVKFKGYSEKEVPSFFFFSSSNKKLKKDEFGENILEQNDFLSYKKWREENGLQTDHVDLTFTGDMFRNLGIVKTGLTSKDVYVVEVGGKTEDSQDKIDWNSDRYKDILRLSKDEEKLLSKVADEEITRIIKNIGV